MAFAMAFKSNANSRSGTRTSSAPLARIATEKGAYVPSNVSPCPPARNSTRAANPFRRGPQRILIRCELYRMNLQLALDFFNRFSRNVDGQPAEVLRYEVFNRSRHP